VIPNPRVDTGVARQASREKAPFRSFRFEFAGSQASCNSIALWSILNSVMANRKSPRNGKGQQLRFNIDTERETDGRWIAEIVDIPGVLAYGRTKPQAKAKAYALALRVIADRVEKSRTVPESISLICASA
jgi:predicted RNase H-like HicB family nuclease